MGVGTTLFISYQMNELFQDIFYFLFFSFSMNVETQRINWNSFRILFNDESII